MNAHLPDSITLEIRKEEENGEEMRGPIESLRSSLLNMKGLKFTFLALFPRETVPEKGVFCLQKSVKLSLACKPKGHWCNSQSGHMPGLQPRSPGGGMGEAMDQCFSHKWCFSPSRSLFKNKWNLKKKIYQAIHWWYFYFPMCIICFTKNLNHICHTLCYPL